MNFTAIHIPGKIIILCLCLVVAAPTMATDKSSSINLTPDGRWLLVSNTDSNSISIVDISVSTPIVAEISVGFAPQTVASDRDGRFAFVTNLSDDTLTVLDLQSLSVAGCVAVSDEPFAVVVGEHHIYVSNTGSNSVTIIDRYSFLPVVEIDTESAPRGLALSSDESELYVTHLRSGKLSVIDVGARVVSKVIHVSTDANLSQSITIHHSTDRACLPQTFSNSSNAALLFDSTVFPVVTVIDLATEEHLRSERLSLDVIDEPVGIPIDAVITSDNKMFVVNAASNDISVVDLGNNSMLAHFEVGDNSRGIALSSDSTLAYVDNSLDGTVSVIDTALEQVTATIGKQYPTQF